MNFRNMLDQIDTLERNQESNKRECDENIQQKQDEISNLNEHIQYILGYLRNIGIEITLDETDYMAPIGLLKTNIDTLNEI